MSGVRHFRGKGQRVGTWSDDFLSRQSVDWKRRLERSGYPAKAALFHFGLMKVSQVADKIATLPLEQLSDS